MASQDTFFKVKTGLGVGTDTFYADTASKSVSIGSSEARYPLDVYGTIFSEENILADNRVGVGTTVPLYELDVRGVGIITAGVGIGTTNPTQILQVNYGSNAVVVTGFGSLAVGKLSPTHDFEVVGSGSSDIVVITGVSSIGIRTDSPTHDFQLITSQDKSNIVITGFGSVGIGTNLPYYDLDVHNNARVVGLATINNEYVGFSTIGIATITNETVGFSTIGIATITNETVGFSTIGIATIGSEVVGFSTIGIASITSEVVGFSTIGIASITSEVVGFSTIGIASITSEVVGFSTIGIASITSEVVGFSTIGIASITSEVVGFSTIGIASITSEVVGFSTIGIASITSEVVGFSTIGIASITSEVVGFSTIGIASITSEVVGFSTIGIATITRETVEVSKIDELLVTGITTTAKLDVGIGATLVKVKSFGITTVTDLEDNFVKEIHPIVGIGTTLPTRTLDVAGDIRIRGEVLDSNNQVGFAYSVLSAGDLVGGRFIDAGNLLSRNKDFIASEVVGFITSTSGPFGINGALFDYDYVGFTTGLNEFKNDIKEVVDAIIFDISRGGNSSVVNIGLSYFDELEEPGGPEDGNGKFAYLRDFDGNNGTLTGAGQPYIRPAVLAGISTIAFVSRYVINNARLPVSYQSGVSSITQLIDTEILPDGDSNANENGCSNVVSAIYSCVGIIASIVSSGPGVAPNINYPSAKLEWKPPGPRIGNEWFVNKLGNDSNKGIGPGDAFLTIKRAAQVAESGDTIKVYAGLYVEDGPIQVPERVAIVGEDLRRTLVTTKDKTDLFHVRRGCYISQMSFVGEENPGKAMVSFPTRGLGYADGTEENWQSPYVQNCTNFVPDSIGMRIDGTRAGGFKSMVLDAYTQYNQGGIGVSITNFGYAQLVSLFTICCDTAVYCDTGGVCDLNNSNCSFGNFGLVSDGATPLQFVGTVVEEPQGDNIDRLVINVGVGASQEFIDAVDLLRLNKDFIASEVVGFITSTDGPFGVLGEDFDYGGSLVGREKCRRDSKLIIESIASDLLTLGNNNSINAGLAYRDSLDGSLTYLPETSPPPVGFTTGYVKQAEIAAIQKIAGISTYIIQNLNVPTIYQSGIGSFTQVKDPSKLYSANAKNFISSSAGIITSIIGIGTTAVPQLILPQGQRPYDGQISVIDTQYYFIREIVIDNPGSGYNNQIPVEITIDLPPNSDFFIPAEIAIFESNVSGIGSILGADVLVSGTGYDINNPPQIIISPPASGVQATAHAVLEKYFFNPVSSTPVSIGGTTTVVFDQFITYPIGVGDIVYFYQSSKIIASSITFEYVGTGINIVNAIPSKGAVPITENEIVATNGGQVPFTSTDQSGDFRISEGITINQNTGTISGTAFSKSLQAEVTPLIIALQS
jgi:hypothetical protein